MVPSMFRTTAIREMWMLLTMRLHMAQLQAPLHCPPLLLPWMTSLRLFSTPLTRN